MNMRYYPTLHIDTNQSKGIELLLLVRVRATKIIIYSSSHPNVTNSCLDMAEKLLS
jgi:hypothetical protein